MGVLSDWKDKIQAEAGRFIEKNAFEDTGQKESKRGRFGGRDWQNMFTAGVFSKSSLKTFTDVSTHDFDSAGGNIQNFEKQQRASVFGANLGHQAVFRDEGENTDAGGAEPMPPVGAGTRSARQDARQRAIDTQKKRFGLSNTVGTTPLGVQGFGAVTGKKRLTGE